MIILSLLMVALGIGAATWKLGELPESISALVYVLPRQGGWRWLWSGWLWAVSLTVGIPLHDAAAMYPEQVTFPKLFKLSDGEDGNAVYHTFESMQEMAQFYLGGLSWIEQCVEEGFHKKDGFDFTPYEKALNG